MTCPYSDKTCPCQDGDVCHYEDHVDDNGVLTKARPNPEGDNNGFPHSRK